MIYSFIAALVVVVTGAVVLYIWDKKEEIKLTATIVDLFTLLVVLSFAITLAVYTVYLVLQGYPPDKVFDAFIRWGLDLLLLFAWYHFITRF